jgi:lipoate-protein ligase A
MHFLELTLPTLAENLALDEALLLEAETSGMLVLRVWSWPYYAVVLGAGGKIADEVDEAACAADQVPVARRGSGGGAVLLGPGCLLYSLVLPCTGACRDINGSHRHVLGETASALADLAPGITHEGTSDLACAGRKFSGNAQQRKRTHFLHHGTLLFAFDVTRVARYLREPARRPAYRGDRDHRKFLMNLPADEHDLVRRLRARWQALTLLGAWPHARVRELVEKQYRLEEWTRRR